jgi:signal transduction histidine kinase
LQFFTLHRYSVLPVWVYTARTGFVFPFAGSGICRSAYFLLISAFLCRFDPNKLIVKRIICLAAFLISFSATQSQTGIDSAAVDVAQINDSVLVLKKALLFIDSNKIATPDNLVQQHFISLYSFPGRKSIPAGVVPKQVYLKYSLVNSGSSAKTFYIFPGQLFTEIQAYRQKADGKLVLLDQKGSPQGYTRMTMEAGERTTCFQQLTFCKNPKNYILPQVISGDYLDNYEKISYNDEMILRINGFVLSGVLLMMIMFMAANFWLSKKKEFLYNCMYSVCMFGLIFLYPLLLRTSGEFFIFFIGYLDFFLMVTGTIFYIAFTRKFLNTKTEYPLLEKIFRAEEIALFFVLLAFSYLHFFTDMFWLENGLENCMKVITLSMGIVYIVIAINQRNRLMNYLAIGNAVLILFGCISLSMIWYKGKKYSILTSAYFYYSVGIVLEIVFFILGLTYKNRKELIATTQAGEAMKLEAEKKEFEAKLAVIKAQQEERNRISADMHDDLGSGMTAIRLYSELAKKKINAAEVPEIDRISSFANELLNKMNAIIWTMSSSNDSLGNLIAYIRSYTLEYFENTGVDCRFTIPEQVPQLEVAGEKRRNIFLTVKETLNNILKHSGAGKVHIEFDIRQEELVLRMHDNGKGIDLDNVREFGNGLKNMKKRMESSGCGFTIENSSGTLVTLTCPL